MRTNPITAFRLLPVFPLVAVLLFAEPGTAQGQSLRSQAFHACYMPQTGVVYLIKQAGLPTACRSDTHVEFTWGGKVPVAGPPGTMPHVQPDSDGQPTNPGPQIVASLNALTGDLVLSATGGATVSSNGDTVTINAGDSHSLDAADGSTVDAVFVDNAGNMGIGTTTPQVTLDVNGPVFTRGSALQMFSVEPGQADRRFTIDVNDADLTRLYNHDDGTSAFHSVRLGGRSTGTEGITVLASGKVGIGTETPQVTLDVNGSVFTRGSALEMFSVEPGQTDRRFTIDVNDADLTRLYNHDDGSSAFHSIRFGGKSSGSEGITVLAGGNVGIGTETPNARLVVSGGDAAVVTQGSGVILKATDGANCYRITVNNAGALSTAPVTCP